MRPQCYPARRREGQSRVRLLARRRKTRPRCELRPATLIEPTAQWCMMQAQDVAAHKLCARGPGPAPLSNSPAARRDRPGRVRARLHANRPSHEDQNHARLLHSATLRCDVGRAPVRLLVGGSGRAGHGGRRACRQGCGGGRRGDILQGYCPDPDRELLDAVIGQARSGRSRCCRTTTPRSGPTLSRRSRPTGGCLLGKPRRASAPFATSDG